MHGHIIYINPLSPLVEISALERIANLISPLNIHLNVVLVRIIEIARTQLGTKRAIGGFMHMAAVHGASGERRLTTSNRMARRKHDASEPARLLETIPHGP